MAASRRPQPRAVYSALSLCTARPVHAGELLTMTTNTAQPTRRTRASSAPATPGRLRLPLQCEDLSSFAKTLRTQLTAHHEAHAGVPGHVQLLNMLARAAGHRNVQALKAQAASERGRQAGEARAPANLLADVAGEVPDSGLEPDTAIPSDAAPALAPVLSPAAAKALTQFDDWGRLTRWPHKFSVQRLAMWALWARFEGGRTYTEREVNDILKAWTIYGDHVTPRRELVEMKLLGRKPDCSSYWKEPRRPEDEARALLLALRARRPDARAGIRSHNRG